MNEADMVVRLAAKGDGVTESGRHVPGAVPGDRILSDGTVERGPHHVDPPCRHFGRCGGCQLQHADEEVVARFVTDRILNAARKQGLEAERVAPAHLSPPRSRRRATLHAARQRGKLRIGFREAGSRRLVDIAECTILLPELFALVSPLRELLRTRKADFATDIALTRCDQGADVAFGKLPVEGLQQTEQLLDFARDNALARLSNDDGYGSETQWEPEPVTVTLTDVPVPLPVGAFLQATRDGEGALVSTARDWLSGEGPVADLFAGLGTFAFALASSRKVLAVEAGRNAHLACMAAGRRSGRPVHALHRDLFRNPLRAEELDRFSGVVLDPPRAGAREQVAQIAASAVSQVAYISCNPSSWARDAKTLVDGGFALREVRPVGQFRWSTHVELASLFER